VTKKRPLVAILVLGVVLYGLLSAALAVGTQGDCDNDYPMHWRLFPPGWECSVASGP